ncbi:acetyl-CoA carboxylase carboxyltransferase subunit alpha [Clostridiisalibacter paucivorans]|uniref:acetyl-CoA carboxylase carboxyltransferase subunit alpha n=1 Tax=Clostridiisalibacter paucivorans TaxID=408753 RepID=UPI00047B2D88|nr:acetyl-CoA carboxylase carboxyltransferase subunit alpha [Clostridiisalibacter paucivorans]
MNNAMDFEKPLIALEEKIKELESISSQNDMDLSMEIKKMREKLIEMKENTYNNLSSWQRVQLARRIDRPTTLDYINNICTDFIEFHGDRAYGDDSAVIGGIGYIDDIAVTIIGHQKGKDTKENITRKFGMSHPEGYRKALRLMKQAEKFNRPIITLIDTPGAYCGLGAEERGQGQAIAVNLMEMSTLKVPIVSVVIGEGGSGGALGLAIADSIAMLENSIYSVISPEGLASILWKDAKLSKKASEVMKLTARDIMKLGVIDKVIKEPLGGAHKDIDFISYEVKKYLIKEIVDLKKLRVEELMKRRYDKFRIMGKTGIDCEYS